MYNNTGQVLQHQHQHHQQQHLGRRQCSEQQVDCSGPSPAACHANFLYTRSPFYYNMGRDSPGMLDMLAEVASQTLHSEKKKSELDAKNRRQKEAKRKSPSQHLQLQLQQQQQPQQLATYNVTQLLTMPAALMIKLFTVFSGDELRKQYSYTCALVPGCGQSYSSFASDTRAKLAIQQHLAKHLEHLKNNADTYASFTATAVMQPKPKSTAQNKKAKTQQTKKPHKETVNKENKETKVGNSNTSTRKILFDEVNLKELENNASHDKSSNLQNSIYFETKKEIIKVKVSGDHSYYGYVQEEIVNEGSTSTVDKIPVNSLTNENIMLMVVENNGASVNDPLSTTTENILNSVKEEDNHIESMTFYNNEPSVIPSSYVPAKPKGKAKFIGTSEEERQRALAEIAKIKKHGNPPGSDLSCAICQPPRSFTAPTTLLSHYRSHAGIKPYACEICNSVFTRRHSLKYHMLIHDNLTRFTCADCGKKFRHPSHFREHRRRHTGEAPFGCEDCGQRFKTRNTYKRHLKTRHNKVLTITGELLHLSEEESKKAKPKSRRKKAEVSESAVAGGPADPLETMSSHSQDDKLTSWEEQQVCDNNNALTEDGQQCINDSLWVYENQTNDVAAEDSYTQIQDKVTINKTDFNETEIEHSFANNEVVIAQTDSNGALHFENYDYAQETVYENGSAMECAEEQVCEDFVEAAKQQYESHEESIVQFEECADDYAESIVPDFEPKTDDSAVTGPNVIVLDNQEVVTTQEVADTGLKELSCATDAIQTEVEMQMDTEDSENIIIPCQVKVCENNGTATLQLIKNSQISLLGNKAQSINLIQNGKQQTYLLLASDEDNLLEVENHAIQESKALPILAVPAK